MREYSPTFEGKRPHSPNKRSRPAGRRRWLGPLHPVREPQQFPDVPNTVPFDTDRADVDKVFSYPAQGRAHGPAHLCFEHLRLVYENGGDDTLYSVVKAINSGRIHHSTAQLLSAADYATALRLGHSVEPIIMEVSGGLTPAACKLLRTLAHVHGAGLGADTNAPWCARSFKSIYTQRLSVALQRAAAEELLDTIRCDASWNDSLSLSKCVCVCDCAPAEVKTERSSY